MENLVPRESYEADETGYWKRLPIAAGLFTAIFGGLMFGLQSFLFDSDFSLQMTVIKSIAYGTLTGIFFALLFPRLFR